MKTQRDKAKQRIRLAIMLLKKADKESILMEQRCIKRMQELSVKLAA